MAKRKQRTKRASEALVAELRQILEAEVLSEAAEALAAGSTWARSVLDGTRSLPSEDLDLGVPEALIAILTERKEAEALGWLAGFRRPSSLAKAARTAAHRLRSTGVDVPVAPAPQAVSRPLPETIADAALSFLSQYDSRSRRLVWLAESHPRGIALYRARISWRGGLLELDSGTTTRREYRRVLRDLEHRDLLTARCDPAPAKWLIQAAARRTKALGRGLPASYLRATRSLSGGSDAPHPALSIAPSTDDLFTIFERPELLLGWISDDETTRRISQGLQAIVDSPIIVDDAQRRERGAALLQEETSRIFADARYRETSHDFFLDLAHLLRLRGDSDTAALLRGAADLFDDPDVGKHPFAHRALSRRFNLDALIAPSATASNQGEGQAPTPPSGLITP
ncbi:MAG: hypothetical protein KAI47_07190 [Deltaproteobacteria bacterium]|nr:hypothetical protein [Deltaproteobacteria bacterium]